MATRNPTSVEEEFRAMVGGSCRPRTQKDVNPLHGMDLQEVGRPGGASRNTTHDNDPIPSVHTAC